MTFNDLRLQVSPSEATAYVALNLLEAFIYIDKILHRPRAAKAKSVAKYRGYSLSQLYFMTTLLRAETRPDRNAAMIGAPRRAASGIDKYNNSSVEPVRHMLKKIEDPGILRNLQSCLGSM